MQVNFGSNLLDRGWVQSNNDHIWQNFLNYCQKLDTFAIFSAVLLLKIKTNSFETRKLNNYILGKMHGSCFILCAF